MSEIITGLRFGNRVGYTPADDDAPYDEDQARIDARYIGLNADEVNISMRYLTQALGELSVQVAVVRELPPERRRYSTVPQSLHTLFYDLYNARDKYQEFSMTYAKLAVEIDERMKDAQRFIVAHTEPPERKVPT